MSFLLGLVLFGVRSCQADKTYLLQYKPPLNKTYRYDIETTLTGAQTAALKLTKAVKAIKTEGGVTTVVTTFDSVSFGMAPSDQVVQAERMVKLTVVTQTIDAQAKVLTSDAGSSIEAFLIGGLDAVYGIGFSASPVKVGDTWQNTVDYRGSKLDVKLKLIKFFSERGKQMADIRMGLATPTDANPNLPISFQVDTTTGVLERLELQAAKNEEGKSMHVSIRLR
jgi:hypothetical protein